MKLKYLSVIILSSLLACNPVKKVLKDPVKFDQVAKEVVKSGKYCVNDTTVITEVKDSIVYKDSIIERITSVPCKDFDTTIGRARIKVSSGVLTYSAKDSVVIRTKTITNSIRDRAYERVLQADLDKVNGLLKNEEARSKQYFRENVKLKADLRKEKVKLWLVIVSLLIIIFRKPITRFIYGFI